MIDPGHPFSVPYEEIIARLESSIREGVEQPETDFFTFQPGVMSYQLRRQAYAVSQISGLRGRAVVRFLAGAEPEVVAAAAKLSSPGVDRWMRADLAFPGGVTGRITTSLFSARLLDVRVMAEGERGRMAAINPFAPHLYHRLSLATPEGTRVEKVTGDATYAHQLRAFVRWIRQGEPMPTDAAHGVANMRVIDAIYRKAGLPIRGV